MRIAWPEQNTAKRKSYKAAWRAEIAKLAEMGAPEIELYPIRIWEDAKWNGQRVMEAECNPDFALWARKQGWI